MLVAYSMQLPSPPSVGAHSAPASLRPAPVLGAAGCASSTGLWAATGCCSAGCSRSGDSGEHCACTSESASDGSTGSVAGTGSGLGTGSVAGTGSDGSTDSAAGTGSVAGTGSDGCTGSDESTGSDGNAEAGAGTSTASATPGISTISGRPNGPILISNERVPSPGVSSSRDTTPSCSSAMRARCPSSSASR
ncbi:hypothetical protein CH296_01025 [Rhodococcus sp. 14-2496-1d]|nr:hypothetical protein CH296_01025 [Rhodococcus sp. 14-2496-1d]